MKFKLYTERGRAAFAAELESTQARSRVRTVTAEQVQAALDSIAARLNIPKCHMVGIRVQLDRNAQDFPSAYKGQPDSTVIFAEYTRGGWCITNVCRWPTQRHNQAAKVTLTDEAKAAILARFETVPKHEL